jgi:nucleotide-binding universal stress UspA family protein
MAYKEILVYADADTACAVRLDVAAALSSALNAHLVALHVLTPPFIPAMPGADVSPDLIDWQQQYQRDKAKTAHDAVEKAGQRAGQNLEWRLVEGGLAESALLHSRYSDLIVVGQSTFRGDEPQEADILPEEIIFQAGRPVLIVPRYGTFASAGEHVLLAWKPTREATRAVHDALPLLMRAKSVTVMEVNPNPRGNHIAGADIAHHLARHGVKANVSSTAASDIDVGDAILSRAADLSADLLVMGAYGHSRVREFVFGGATRAVLRSMTLPVLMSH